MSDCRELIVGEAALDSISIGLGIRLGDSNNSHDRQLRMHESAITSQFDEFLIVFWSCVCLLLIHKKFSAPCTP